VFGQNLPVAFKERDCAEEGGMRFTFPPYS